MKNPKQRKRRPKYGYVLLPSVTHPQGREKAFDDAMKTMGRAMIEINNNPTVAYQPVVKGLFRAARRLQAARA